MHKYHLFFIFLFMLSTLFLPAVAIAQEPAPETAPAVNPVPTVPPAPPPDAPNPAAAETANPSLTETTTTTTATTITNTTLTTNTTIPNAPTPGLPTTGIEEGASYKDIPWGADFNAFKSIKNFPGDLGPLSAAFLGTNDDNIIALLLGVPASAKDANGSQRVMFEYVPRKFASVYFEPDDTYYIFYNGKFAVAFSKINENNFELYRDTFYKKYTKTGSFAHRYDLAANKSYVLHAAIFEKGKTGAFLIKGQLIQGKKTFVSARILFVFNDSFAIICQEIKDKIFKSNLPGNEKNTLELEKDLNKIE